MGGIILIGLLKIFSFLLWSPHKQSRKYEILIAPYGPLNYANMCKISKNWFAKDRFYSNSAGNLSTLQCSGGMLFNPSNFTLC